MAGQTQRFGAWDYVVFALMLGVSAVIGIFYGCRGNKQSTTKEFLMANRSMSIVPVSVSILVSFMSAILILGTPAEMYTAGTQYWLNVIGMALAITLASQMFVPLFYPLGLTSSFEYLELRFKSRLAKIVGTFIMIVQSILYMGIASFAPSTALEAVTGFPVWATILIVGLFATFYTTLGGMKAVVWTDVFQSLVMIAGLLAVLVQGVVKVGGMDRVWSINEEWGRINFFDFDPDPTIRHSTWSLVVGGMVGWTATYGCNQASVQRYCALPTLRKAKISVLLNIVGVFILMTVTCLVGVAVFAYNVQRGCDPYTAGILDNPNQLVPYFVMEVLNFPGLPGLFISCLFSGALSSVSSSLNALSAVTWEDFLKPFLDKRLSETKKAWVTKGLVLVYGAAGVGMAFMAKGLGGTVLQASLSFTGAASGPGLGLFVLGAFFPWANKHGAVAGGLLGLAFPLWISIGAYSLPAAPYALPFPTGSCDVILGNVTASPVTITPLPPVVRQLEGIERLYSVSYLWYPAIGTATTVIVGMVVSAITGFTRLEEVEPKYLIPVFDRVFCCLPASWRRTLRCGKEFPDPNKVSHYGGDVSEKENDSEKDGPNPEKVQHNAGYESDVSEKERQGPLYTATTKL